MCVNHRFIYIDTSAILSIGTNLEGRDYFQHVFTSYMSIMELLSRVGHDEISYIKRRRLIKFLYDNYIVAFNTHPDYKKFDAFTYLTEHFTVNRPYDDYLNKIVSIVLACESLDSFNEQLEAKHLVDAFDLLIDFDNYLGSKHLKINAEMIQELKQGYDATGITEASQAALGLQKDATFAQLLSAMRDHPYERSGGLTLLALALKGSCDINNGVESKQLAEKIFNSYDRSLDPYLRAISYQAFTPAIEGRTPARNDGVDVEHFTYLCNNCQFLSNDKQQNATARSIGVALWQTP